MTFEWQTFLDQYGIAYRQAGRGNLRVDCPWCNDGGNPNMQISLDGRGWHCWACAERGRHPAKLMVKLANISLQEAQALTGSRVISSNNVIDQVAAALAPIPTSAELPPLPLPSEFKPFSSSRSAEPFVDYLQRRGFAAARIAAFSSRHDVYYCRHGRWRYRIIFAITQHGQLRSWTGRSIVASDQVRYLAASAADGAVATTDTLPWLDQLQGGARLLLCEGPFDALKLREFGEHASCCFSAAPSPRQISLLAEALPRYRRRVLLLDRGTAATALTAQRAMAGLGVEIAILRHRKDPACIESRLELDSILGQG
jgi:hypothetical protein